MQEQDIIKFNTLSKELEGLQQHAKKIQEHIHEVNTLLTSLDEFSQTSTASKALFPLANGIFVEGTITNNKTLKVNVGQGVVVEKTIDETKQLVLEQLHNLKKQQELLYEQETKTYEELVSLEQQVREQQEVRQ